MQQDTNTVSKVLSAREAEAYRCLEQWDLAKIAPPYTRDGTSMTMAKGSHPSRLGLDLPKLYRQVLQPMYEIGFDGFSPGIYCFMEACGEDGNFAAQLIQTITQRRSAQTGTRSGELHTVLQQSCQRVLDVLPRLATSWKPSAVLLHGDLFLGNILEYGNDYRLIDFEYLRAGPREMELAFCLCWDFLSNPELCPYADFVIGRDADALVQCGALDGFTRQLILEGLIPAIVALTCLNIQDGLYRFPAPITAGVTAFWQQYRCK